MFNGSIYKPIKKKRGGKSHTPLEQEILEALRTRFFRSRMTRVELAERMGCSSENVKQVLTGFYFPSIRTLIKLVFALDCELTIKIKKGDCEVRVEGVVDGNPTLNVARLKGEETA